MLSYTSTNFERDVEAAMTVFGSAICARGLQRKVLAAIARNVELLLPI